MSKHCKFKLPLHANINGRLISYDSLLKVMEAFHKAETIKRAKPTDMFEDVFDKLPANLEKQKKEMLEHIKNYKNEYPLDLYEKL